MRVRKRRHTSQTIYPSLLVEQQNVDEKKF